MNYNNNNNPYYTNPYAYSYNNYQPMQQQVQYQQQPQTNYLPLTFVSGVEGAKAFIVNPNSIIYLKDSDSNILFEKKADQQGKYSLKAFELREIEIGNIGKDTNSNPISTDRFIMKDDVKDFVTKSDLTRLETLFDSRIDKLSHRIEKLARNGLNNVKQKDSE